MFRTQVDTVMNYAFRHLEFSRIMRTCAHYEKMSDLTKGLSDVSPMFAIPAIASSNVSCVRGEKMDSIKEEVAKTGSKTILVTPLTNQKRYEEFAKFGRNEKLYKLVFNQMLGDRGSSVNTLVRNNYVIRGKYDDKVFMYAFDGEYNGDSSKFNHLYRIMSEMAETLKAGDYSNHTLYIPELFLSEKKMSGKFGGDWEKMKNSFFQAQILLAHVLLANHVKEIVFISDKPCEATKSGGLFSSGKFYFSPILLDIGFLNKEFGTLPVPKYTEIKKENYYDNVVPIEAVLNQRGVMVEKSKNFPEMTTQEKLKSLAERKEKEVKQAKEQAKSVFERGMNWSKSVYSRVTTMPSAVADYVSSRNPFSDELLESYEENDVDSYYQPGKKPKDYAKEQDQEPGKVQAVKLSESTTSESKTKKPDVEQDEEKENESKNGIIMRIIDTLATTAISVMYLIFAPFLLISIMSKAFYKKLSSSEEDKLDLEEEDAKE